MDATGWTAVGSIATAAAAVIAGITIVISMRSSRIQQKVSRLRQEELRRQREDEEAARVRKTIRIFAASADRLIVGLRAGSALLGAVAWTMDHLRRELPDSPTMADVWRFVDVPGNVFRAAAIGFACDSAQVIARDKQAMQIADQELVGELDLLSSAGRLVVGAHDDVNRPSIFVDALAPEKLKGFKQGDGSTDVDELLLNLTSFLQSSSVLYAVARYDEALKELNSFIEEATEVLTRLDTLQLLSVARSKAAVEPSSTYTADMRTSIDVLAKSQILRPADVTKLTDRVDRIETLLAKEGALDRARRLTSGSAP